MKNSNRHVLPHTSTGVLRVVATPIGNMADLSPRARDALESCQTILCEDTRRSAQLLAAAKIAKSMSRLERLDAHTGEAQLERWIERLKAGESFALVTDAGTPAVSDPGAALVAKAHENRIAVVPVPGASAVLALLAASGFGETSFCFRGFFPRKTAERAEELERAAKSGLGGAFVWFESPQRMGGALEALAAAFPDARVVAGKELTKLYERLFVGTAGEVSEQVSGELTEQGAIGEWAFAAVFPASDRAREESSEWVKALHCLLDAGISASDAARRVSQSFGAPKKAVYDEALRASGKKKR